MLTAALQLAFFYPRKVYIHVQPLIASPCFWNKSKRCSRILKRASEASWLLLVVHENKYFSVRRVGIKGKLTLHNTLLHETNEVFHREGCTAEGRKEIPSLHHCTILHLKGTLLEKSRTNRVLNSAFLGKSIRSDHLRALILLQISRNTGVQYSLCQNSGSHC